MIFEPQSYSFIFQDAIYSIAIGFMTGFINQLLSVFLYKGKVKVFVRDILVSFVFAVLLYSYSISFTNYNVLRWYNVVMAFVGAVLFAPCFGLIGRTAVDAAGITVRFFLRRSAAAVGKKAVGLRRKSAEKRQKFPQKNDEELLKPEDIMLYN